MSSIDAPSPWRRCSTFISSAFARSSSAVAITTATSSSKSTVPASGCSRSWGSSGTARNPWSRRCPSTLPRARAKGAQTQGQPFSPSSGVMATVPSSRSLCCATQTTPPSAVRNEAETGVLRWRVPSEHLKILQPGAKRPKTADVCGSKTRVSWFITSSYSAASDCSAAACRCCAADVVIASSSNDLLFCMLVRVGPPQACAAAARKMVRNALPRMSPRKARAVTQASASRATSAIFAQKRMSWEKTTP
mmetsp:Transcript_29424/g.99121  ORF Transcript_29424/g.99121 Transcript_29424/m.99121 type:complete len:249 (+) Transcript_29424:52-798(+)